RRLLPHEGRQTPEGAAQANLGTTARGGYFYLATSGYFDLAIDIRQFKVREFRNGGIELSPVIGHV
ncbi:hypothetical protein, partial [Mycobacterium sp. PSTR-4-N]|uniref:hypothetical protein n=1 Tax=Mycobacterium sp. PSTR-4-N TaxID=2917745 RepID=UPI001F14BC1C